MKKSKDRWALDERIFIYIHLTYQIKWSAIFYVYWRY